MPGMSYNPGVTSQVGEIYARSNQMFGQALMALMGALGQQGEQAKAESSQGKSADAWFNSLGEQGPQVTGMSKEAWNNQSAKGKWDAFQGVTKAQATKEVLGQLQQQQAQARGGAALSKAIAGAAEPTYDATAAGGGKVNDPSSRLLQAIMANPDAAQSPQGQSILKDLIDRTTAKAGQFFQPGQAGSTLPIAGVAGARLVPTGPNSSQVIFPSDGGAPTPAGFVKVPDARGGFKTVRDYSNLTPNQKLTNMTREAGNLENARPAVFGKDRDKLDARLKDLRTQIDQLEQQQQGGGAQDGAAGAGTPDGEGDPLGLFQK